MSSPRNLNNSVREGTRVVLREITASLHNSPPIQPLRRKSGNESSVAKTAEHEVKVRFAREFADAGSTVAYSVPESLSSASSFQSLSSSFSTKSSSGICADSVPPSPNQASNVSYVSTNIPGVEDLILACADIHLNSDDDQSFQALQNSQDLSQDQTFASATDEPAVNITRDFPSEISLDDSQKISLVFESTSTIQETSPSSLNRTQDIQDRPILVIPCGNNSIVKAEESKERLVSSIEISTDTSNSLQTCDFTSGIEELSLPQFSTEESNLDTTVSLSPTKTAPDIANSAESVPLENNSAETPLSPKLPPITSASSISVIPENAEDPSLPSISLSSLTIDLTSEKHSECDVTDNVKNLLTRTSSPVSNLSEEVIVSPQTQLKSPIQETVNKSISFVEALPLSPCTIKSDEEICKNSLNDTPALVPKTPEVNKSLEASDHELIEDLSATINITENTVLKADITEIIASPLNKKEDNSLTVYNNKLDDSLDIKEVDLKVSEIVEKTDVPVVIKEEPESVQNENEEQSSEEKLDSTLTLEDTSLHSETVPEVELYTEFKPQRQSTTLSLPPIAQPNFEELKADAEQVANDIFKSSLEFTEDSDYFATATSDIFQDPTSFDFLIAHGNSKTINRLRTESLYVKFDPLVGDLSMLPQGNTQPLNEEQNGKNESSPPPNIDTPKRSPAIAAIDRLLFYSPVPTNTVKKKEEPQEKIEQPVEEPKPEIPLINDVNLSKELELVRATVLQLEEELEKQKKEHKAELERQKNVFQEKMNKMQAQVAQEIKSKSQMTVVVEEYEKSISRLLTERERDRTNFEQEKSKVQEELQATNVHLTNTEAAFNDVHQKYERLKGVVNVYKNNEAVLKEGIQENMETIKSLEQRYDQMKSHAMSELEKANMELESIRKQHEDETVKLYAMVRKAELKSHSMAELVEQKTKENKELTQILDEVIARVGHQNTE